MRKEASGIWPPIRWQRSPTTASHLGGGASGRPPTSAVPSTKKNRTAIEWAGVMAGQ